MSGFEFFIQVAFLAARVEEQPAVHALELAVDVLASGDGFDLVNGARMAVVDQARRLSAQLALGFEIAIIPFARQMRTGAAGLAVADLLVVNDQHRSPRSDELIRDREPGDAGAHDTHITFAIAVDR